MNKGREAVAPAEPRPLTARPVGESFIVAVRGWRSRVAEQANGRAVESPMISIGEGCYRRMPTCRGFGYVELVVVAAVVAALVLGAMWFYHAGATAKQAEWDKDKAAKAAATLEQQHDISDAVKEGEDLRAAANQRAAQSDQAWEEANRERIRHGVDLAACEDARSTAGTVAAAPAVGGEPAAQDPRAAGVAGGEPRAGVRLRWRFVGMHDGAFTAADGGLVFGDSAQYALDASRADTTAPYTLDDVLEVGKDNAVALSVCRREFFALRGRVERAALAVDKGRK